MPAPLFPAIQFTRGQNVRVQIAMSPAVDVTTWGLCATIRQDPAWPRVMPDAALAKIDVDPAGEGWPIVAQVSTVAAVNLTQGVFAFDLGRDITQLMAGGSRRYVLDIWRTDSGATYPLVLPTWLDVNGPVFPYTP